MSTPRCFGCMRSGMTVRMVTPGMLKRGFVFLWLVQTKRNVCYINHGIIYDLHTYITRCPTPHRYNFRTLEQPYTQPDSNFRIWFARHLVELQWLWPLALIHGGYSCRFETVEALILHLSGDRQCICGRIQELFRIGFCSCW